MAKSTPPIKIVLAEDEPTIATAYNLGLSHHGFEVILAADGKEALVAIEKHQPDIVLLDVIMPHMTGLEVLEVLRDDPKLHKLPVIILSNLDQPSDTVSANDLGAKAYLIKANLSLKELVEYINDAVDSAPV